MKRHLLILAPAYIVFTFIVACGGGSEDPPPVASLPKITNDFKCAANRFDDALKKCKSGVGDILPLLLAQQQQGGQSDASLAILIASMNKGQSQAPTPIALPNGDACPKPQVDNSSSCKDDMITAFLLMKSSTKTDGTLAINDPAYRKWIELKIRQYIQVASMQFNLNPQQQLYLGTTIMGALNSGALNGAIAAGDLSVLNSYLNTPQMAALASTPTPAPQGWPISTPGLNTGNQGFYNSGAVSTPGTGTSTRLTLNVGQGARAVVEDSSKVQQTVGVNQLRQVPKGVGLPSRAIAPRL